MAGAPINQGSDQQDLLTTPLNDTPSMTTTPLHSFIFRELTWPVNRGPLCGGLFSLATPLPNTASRRHLSDDDTPSRHPLDVSIATRPAVRAVQRDAPGNRRYEDSPLCEVNRQTPISKRGGVKAVFLNLCREAGNYAKSVVRKYSGAEGVKQEDSEHAKSLGLDMTVGALAQRKFAGERKSPVSEEASRMLER